MALKTSSPSTRTSKRSKAATPLRRSPTTSSKVPKIARKSRATVPQKLSEPVDLETLSDFTDDGEELSLQSRAFDTSRLEDHDSHTLDQYTNDIAILYPDRDEEETRRAKLRLTKETKERNGGAENNSRSTQSEYSRGTYGESDSYRSQQQPRSNYGARDRNTHRTDSPREYQSGERDYDRRD